MLTNVCNVCFTAIFILNSMAACVCLCVWFVERRDEDDDDDMYRRCRRNTFPIEALAAAADQFKFIKLSSRGTAYLHVYAIKLPLAFCNDNNYTIKMPH